MPKQKSWVMGVTWQGLHCTETWVIPGPGCRRGLWTRTAALCPLRSPETWQCNDAQTHTLGCTKILAKVIKQALINTGKTDLGFCMSAKQIWSFHPLYTRYRDLKDILGVSWMTVDWLLFKRCVSTAGPFSGMNIWSVSMTMVYLKTSRPFKWESFEFINLSCNIQT